MCEYIQQPSVKGAAFYPSVQIHNFDYFWNTSRQPKPIAMNRLYFMLFCLAPLFCYNGAKAQIQPIRPYNSIKALIVGVSDYQQTGIPDLNYAHRDAMAFAHYLREESPWPIAPKDLVVLTNQEATYGNFISELTAMVERCEPNDRFLLYFSGHGSIEAASDGPMGYWLMHDAPPHSYASGGACKITTLNDYFQQIVREKKADIVLVSDACRSGTLAEKPFKGAQATTAAMAELFTGTIKLLSCEISQLSYESPNLGGGRGIFSYYLVEGMKGYADLNENQFVDLFELERYVQDQVREASKGRQHPFRQGGSSDFKVSRVKAGALPQPPPAAPPQPDTSYLPDLAEFERAITNGHLLYPEDGSAYQIYQRVLALPNATNVQQAMRFNLMSALQDEAQSAINEYITTPGKEVAKRWANKEVYAHFPAYLATAAELTGEQNLFYRDIKSREYYFRGVNLRLETDAMDNPPDSLIRRAIKWQRQALKLNPLSPHIYNELGLLYRDLGETTQEIYHFQRALALAPTWGLVLSNLGLSYKNQSQPQLAEELYLDALAKDSTLAMARFNLAVLYRDNGALDKAEKAYLQTIQIDPNFAEVYYDLAFIYAEDEARSGEALQMLQEYQRHYPDEADGYTLQTYLHLKRGEPDAALTSTLAALQADSTYIYALQHAVYLHVQQAQYERALPFLNRMIRHYPKQRMGYRDKAFCLLRLNRKDQAVQVIGRLLENGFRDYEKLQGDPGLAPLQQDPAYQRLMQAYFPEKTD